ncbi:3D-(3,5/4)-trihydroxycyclohexane-1,2-dione acylhydrolase (decyclizing) [Myxococcota bacterium]|nr:3D-(3,5/4)-trihydroxycyclohexane-1,2-dione acylhydrolase (decyclizing) [Myxococcota bacterium]
MGTVKLTLAQALVRAMAAEWVELEGREEPMFAGVFAIFGHGNVTGLGEALATVRDQLPTFRAHNEQAMAHAATAFAKASFRRRMMACTTSIGPGATNLVTAAATAHVNRLPILLLPGDVFASRTPDPVLQQLEVFGDATMSVNDCLRPVSRYFDRLTRPEQLVATWPQAVRVLTDPVDCGPVTLALPQDVQTEAYDFPEHLFTRRVHHLRRPRPDRTELARAVELLGAAKRPLIVAGGGVLYSDAARELGIFAEYSGIPVVETQAGKGALPWSHPQNAGGLGVTGTSAANSLAAEADVVLAIGTRLTDFTTASRTIFKDPDVAIVGLNVAPFDAHKHRQIPLVADAREGLAAITEALREWSAPPPWTVRGTALATVWSGVVDGSTMPRDRGLPSDAEVLGAVNRAAGEKSVVVGAAGGIPGELHKLWRAVGPGGYHVEYGYSCMGYEIAGALGVKLATPEREVFVLVGDGSYLMMSSELATSVMLGLKLVVIVLDNHGFGCIHRLQQATGGAEFNNLLAGCGHFDVAIDFAAHARALGANAEKVASIDELSAALDRARGAMKTSVVVIETDPDRSTSAGGAWWEVPVAEVSKREAVQQARAGLVEAKKRQRT